MRETILLTGATGHVGTALLPRLLAPEGTRVIAIVRARDPAHLARRRSRIVEGLEGERVLTVAGDVSRPMLGMEARDHQRVLAEATAVLHSAASVRFDLPEDRAVEQNIQATRNILALARALHGRGRLVRYDHVSTAYVAGARTGRVYEHECDEGQGFRNSYEWSKCQAEEAVRAAIAEGIPAAIHRPSIVVGDSRTGRTDSFNVLYWPLKLYIRGWWRTLPGELNTRVDIVPIDFVAAAIARIRTRPDSLGGCYHLAVGDEAPTIGQLMERVRALTGGPPLRAIDQQRYRRFVRPLLWPFWITRRGRTIRRGGDAFMPYLTGNQVFDTTEAARRLASGDAPLLPPPVIDYLEHIVRYATERDFGRA